MSRPESRVNEQFVIDQKANRKLTNDAPGQAGGLPELKDRVELIEEILALRVAGT